MKNNFRQISVENVNGNTLDYKKIILLVIGGLIVGFLAGLFGGGGGIVVVPLLTTLCKLKDKEAHATSIAIIFPMAIVCCVVYFLTGAKLEFDTGIGVTIGVVLGGLVGTFLLKKLSTNILKIVFYVVMIVAGIKMFL